MLDRASELQASDRMNLTTVAKPLVELAERYKDGLKQHERVVIRKLLNLYLSVEKARGASAPPCPGGVSLD